MKPDLAAFGNTLHITGYCSNLKKRATHEDVGESELATSVIELACQQFGLLPERVKLYDVEATRKSSTTNGIEVRPGGTSFEQVVLSLEPHLSPGDIVLNLITGFDTLRLARRIATFGAHTLCPALEFHTSAPGDDCFTEGLATAYEAIIRWRETNKDTSTTPTAIFGQSSTPGLVSQLTRLALEDFASSQGISCEDLSEGEVARKLSIDAILFTDRDTQLTEKPVLENVFANTYSGRTLLSESAANVEVAVHYRDSPPPHSLELSELFPSVRLLPLMGCETLIRTLGPEGEDVGFFLRSDETLSTLLALEADSSFSPFVARVTIPCPAAVQSLENYVHREYMEQESTTLLTKELMSGESQLGVTLISRKNGVWWSGMTIELDRSREFVPDGNAMLFVTACGVLGSLFACIDEPNRGYLLPHELPARRLLSSVETLLGEVQSKSLGNADDAQTFLGKDGESVTGRLVMNELNPALCS